MKNYFSQLYRQKEIDLPGKPGRYAVFFFRASLCGVAATMPFNNLPFFKLANSYSIILLAIAWLLEGNFSSKLMLFKHRPLIAIFVMFYLLFCVGILYTSNLSTGTFNLEKKSFLVLLPVVIGTSITYGKSELRVVLKVFVAVCFIATIICLVNAFYRFSISGDSRYFVYTQLASVIDFHPPYFGMYVAFSILILMAYLLGEHNKVTRKLLLSALVFYFFCFIILLSARMATAFLFLSLIFVVVQFAIRKKRWSIGIPVLIVMAATTTLIINKSQDLRDRIIKPLTSDISISSGGGETGLSIRLVEWKCSLEGFLEAPAFGLGTGDAIDYLFKCYENENFWGQYPQYNYNSHNQYLQTAITLGLPGLICFLLCMIIPFRFAYVRRNHLFIFFVSLFSFCALTESVLERQWGVVFFAFFVSAFYFSSDHLISKNNEQKHISGL